MIRSFSKSSPLSLSLPPPPAQARVRMEALAWTMSGVSLVTAARVSKGSAVRWRWTSAPASPAGTEPSAGTTSTALCASVVRALTESCANATFLNVPRGEPQFLYLTNIYDISRFLYDFNI